MNILITGCAGFIGYHLTKSFLKYKKVNVFGIDNLNSYYDVKLKKNRLKLLKNLNTNFKFQKIDIANLRKLSLFFKKNKINYVFHLAAQAGVRYSIIKPKKYFDSNMIGFFNILECSRQNKINHLVFASTSSVYGKSNKFPLKEDTNTDRPLSFYAATKKSNEVMAYSYSNIYNLPCTGVRFFTVYGPNGRPDMALYLFADLILKSKKINLFNKGLHERDFTYIDDVISALVKLIKKPSKKNPPFEIFNIGNGKPQKLKKFIFSIEKNLKKYAKTKNFPIQKGDVIKTHADISKLKKAIKYQPKTDIEDGIKNFIDWFLKK